MNNYMKNIHETEDTMKNGIEIRWHGRGGQGAKTAALLLADVAFKTGQNSRDSRSMVRNVWGRRSQRTTVSVRM